MCHASYKQHLIIFYLKEANNTELQGTAIVNLACVLFFFQPLEDEEWIHALLRRLYIQYV